MDAIVIDQSMIRIDPDLKVKPGSEFPRPLAWWQSYAPGWLDVTEDADGHLVLTPNGVLPNGRQRDLTPALVRRYLAATRRWMDGLIHLDFTDALLHPSTDGGA